jgi:hypothetical protein
MYCLAIWAWRWLFYWAVYPNCPLVPAAVAAASGGISDFRISVPASSPSRCKKWYIKTPAKNRYNLFTLYCACWLALMLELFSSIWTTEFGLLCVDKVANVYVPLRRRPGSSSTRTWAPSARRSSSSTRRRFDWPLSTRSPVSRRSPIFRKEGNLKCLFVCLFLHT